MSIQLAYRTWNNPLVNGAQYSRFLEDTLMHPTEFRFHYGAYSDRMKYLLSNLPLVSIGSFCARHRRRLWPISIVTKIEIDFKCGGEDGDVHSFWQEVIFLANELDSLESGKVDRMIWHWKYWENKQFKVISFQRNDSIQSDTACLNS